MQRPWQIWSIFALCLAAVMVAVGWLSFKALEADERDAQSRRQAVLEENARLALWRMDSYMAPLVAQESTRPYFVYRPFLPAERVSGKATASKSPSTSAETLVPSPLLAQANPVVSLYCQINADGACASPQYPIGIDQQRAVPQLLTADQLRTNGRILAQVEAKIDRAKLLAELPPLEPVLPQADHFGQALLPNYPRLSNAEAQQQVASIPQAQIATPQQQMPNAPQLQQQAAANSPDTDIDSQQEEAPVQSPPAQEQSARSRAEFQSRAKLVQQRNTANVNYGLNNDFYNWTTDSPTEVRMSIMKPLWLDGDLLLARRVAIGDRELVQAAVLNWPAIRRQLLTEVADLLPEADLQPAANGDETAEVRRLASLPLQLIPGPLPNLAAAGLTPVRLSLFVAWIAMALAAAAVAALLRGVIALSERRAAFVSAVTHELRTPLTTFRMYAEMLSEGMVREEPDRRRYLETLRREAERLTHLVANVLAYARLERGRSGNRVEVVSVERLLEVATQRLADRAAQCELKLNVAADDDVLQRQVKADPSAVEQILFNLVDNACKYAAAATDRTLQLFASAANGAVCLRLHDHGPGVSPEEQRRLFQPFRKSAKDAAHSAPGVGLGLSLSRRLARDMHGELRYEPKPNGACFVLTLPVAEQVSFSGPSALNEEKLL